MRPRWTKYFRIIEFCGHNLIFPNNENLQAYLTFDTRTDAVEAAECWAKWIDEDIVRFIKEMRRARAGTKAKKAKR